MELTNSQQNAINKLFDKFQNREINKHCYFKSPTGSGKTFMASEFISRVFESQIFNDKVKTVFVIATISNADLPKQFAKKLKDYKQYHTFKEYKIEHISSPSTSQGKKMEDIKEFVLEDNKVFVFGVSSFGKNTLFNQNKTLETFIQNAKNQNYQIFFIRDEAHIGRKENISKSDLETFDDKIKKTSSFILEMTATPKSRENIVELTINELNEDDKHLLKKTQQKPSDLADGIENEELINHAIKIFKNSKKEYGNIKETVIRPAMLIQIMNNSDYEKDKIKNQMFHEGLELLEKKLNEAGLIYLKYLDKHEVVGSNVPATLDYASKIDSPIDVIIFKVGPATGWDIPRANMLLQLRNVSSESLNIQTLGRIMRNPFPNLEFNEVTDKYYLYSNYQKPSREIVNYKLKSKFENKNFYRGIIDRENTTFKKNFEDYKKGVINFLNSKNFSGIVKDFSDGDFTYDEVNYDSKKVINPIKNFVLLKIYNIKKFNEFEEKYSLTSFSETLEKVSKKLNINLEKVKYIFLSILNTEINKIQIKNSKWEESSEPYILRKDATTKNLYQIYKDNDKPKKVDTLDFVNYGYIQIEGEENIQFLDSEPEKQFYEKFKNETSSLKRGDIKFFAKMPTLGSKVYFEYPSKLNGKITKSFMDFAIEYKDKTIMVEVKSYDSDYNEEKTKELSKAYKMYMKNNKEKNIYLVLYQYCRNKESKQHYLSLMNKENKWVNDSSFKDAFEMLLD